MTTQEQNNVTVLVKNLREMADSLFYSEKGGWTPPGELMHQAADALERQRDEAEKSLERLLMERTSTSIE